VAVQFLYYGLFIFWHILYSHLTHMLHRNNNKAIIDSRLSPSPATQPTMSTLYRNVAGRELESQLSCDI